MAAWHARLDGDGETGFPLMKSGIVSRGFEMSAAHQLYTASLAAADEAHKDRMKEALALVLLCCRPERLATPPIAVLAQFSTQHSSRPTLRTLKRCAAQRRGGWAIGWWRGPRSAKRRNRIECAAAGPLELQVMSAHGP
jgi:hypothetical protein